MDHYCGLSDCPSGEYVCYCEIRLKANSLKHVHGFLTVAWVLMVPISLATGWIKAIVFVSACSIYANAVGHFSAWQAARAEKEANNDGD